MKRRSHSRSLTPGRSADLSIPLGKLPARLLDRLLAETVLVDSTVVQGPGTGKDAAIIGTPVDELLVVTSDPITFTASDVGHHLLAVNINDIVTTGACPRWLVLNLLFPPETSERDVEVLFQSIGEACKHFEITLTGGHTEITDAVTRPVAVGTLLGTMKPDRKVDTSRARPGDAVLLIGGLAIEGTALLAKEFAEDVEVALGSDLQKRAERLLTDPGLCVWRPALLAVSRYLAHALHDPTEGGLATALWELGAVTGCGIEADKNSVVIYPETETICEHFKIDPFGLLASGALLAVLPEGEAGRLGDKITRDLELPTSIIGVLTKEPSCVWRGDSGTTTPIPEFARDELARFFESRSPKPPKPPKSPAAAKSAKSAKRTRRGTRPKKRGAG